MKMNQYPFFCEVDFLKQLRQKPSSDLTYERLLRMRQTDTMDFLSLDWKSSMAMLKAIRLIILYYSRLKLNACPILPGANFAFPITLP